MPAQCLGTLKVVAGCASLVLSQASVFSGRSQRKIHHAGSKSPGGEDAAFHEANFVLLHWHQRPTLGHKRDINKQDRH